MAASDRGADRQRLELLPGGLESGARLGRMRIVAAPAGSPPFTVEALVAEEDTYLVLSAPARFTAAFEDPLRLMTALVEAEPVPPGSVLVREASPLRLLAVVHDLAREPSWRERWVGEAFAGVFRAARRRRVRSLGLPLLGTVHGRLPAARSAALLGRALSEAREHGPERLWLIVPAGRADELLRQVIDPSAAGSDRSPEPR